MGTSTLWEVKNHLRTASLDILDDTVHAPTAGGVNGEMEERGADV